MIKKIIIKNFKSVADLTLDLGRINVFIGENGSGKSNILETIAMGAAAAKKKLDNEFLINRGIRVTDPRFMTSAFTKTPTKNAIEIEFEAEDGKRARFNLSNENEPYSKWHDVLYVVERDKKDKEIIPSTIDIDEFTELVLKNLKNKRVKDKERIFIEAYLKNLQEKYSGSEFCKNFEDFLIFSPENSYLRNFEAEGQIEPLGRKGEGLFKLLKTFFINKDNSKVNELIENLKLFDWLDNIEIPKDLVSSENKLSIKDKYIFSKIDKTFDQRSTSEGFLYVLFYTALMISENTPSFFAIENIENALNPKLCAKVTKNLVALSKKHNKQIILTTHNPSILDGLNLDDKEQKLFVIYRNPDGHTISKNYTKPQPVKGEPLVKLSEAFLRGYLGGLPKNFEL